MVKPKDSLPRWIIIVLLFIGTALGSDIYNFLKPNDSINENLKTISLPNGEDEIIKHLKALKQAFKKGGTDYACTVNLQLAEVIAESYLDITSKSMEDLKEFQKQCGKTL